MDNNNEFIHEDEQSPSPYEPAQSQTVSPLRGFFWLERSLSEIYAPHFKVWFIAALIYSLMTTLIPALLPPTAFLFAIINPMLVAGLLLGAHAVYIKQGGVKPLQLFEAFKHPNVVQLMVYTVLAIALVIVAVIVLMSIIGFDTLNAIDFTRVQAGDEAYTKSVLKQISPAIPWGVLLFLLISLATWFAVSLILFSGQNALPSLGNSLVGGLKNFFAVLVFVLTLIVCGIVIVLLSSLILTMFGSLLANPLVNLLFNVLINTLVMPIFIGVTYIAYREIFLGDITKSENSL
ncbi:hypothetical protein GCM10009123_09480 [Kangiella japonica]|uniref:Transmembrane protein n=1 Tax=Kangiella japonica TaxID=647384 RepID=A0ABP3CGM3_9GAMM